LVEDHVKEQLSKVSKNKKVQDDIDSELVSEEESGDDNDDDDDEEGEDDDDDDGEEES
jgi:hypothetical protein